MKEKGRHSRGSGNPGYLKEARLPEITRYFSLKGPAWMPALNHPRYRARLRGHDELRHSLRGGEGAVQGFGLAMTCNDIYRVCIEF